jgi:hypothetical protein
MPFNTEDLADKFGSSAEDIRKNLDGLIEKAEDADKAFESLTKRQEYAVKIQDKFATAMTASSKSMLSFGRSGNTAVRGLKAVGAISKTVASSLGSIGVGAGAAAGGFKALSSEASSFTSDLSRTEKSVAGFISSIGGLEKKLKGIKSASIPVEMVVGSLSALDDIEKRLKALSKNVKVKISTVSAGAASQPSPSVAPASAGVTQKAAKAAKAAADKQQALQQQRYALERELEKKSSYSNPGSDEIQTAKKKNQEIGKAAESAKYRQVSEFVKGMDDAAEAAFLLDKKIMGLDKAVEKLISNNQELGQEVVLAMDKAGEAVEELYSPLNQLREKGEMTVKSFKDLFKKDIAGGAVKELEDFAGGAGKSATGMTAAGLAVAYLTTKVGDLARKFADAAVGLAKYKTETAALERTIIGISKGGLDQMRKQLDLTRAEAAGFFEVVKKGANELGMTQDKIMEVAKALSDTFGGTQTERLKQYIDLLESIPTIESDLKVTANMDDQAAAIFALAEAGKMEVVMDLQGAGLLGGQKEKKPGADMANAAAKTARVTEEINDFLLNKLFPTFGQYLSEIVSGLTQVVAVAAATFSAFTALAFLTRAATVSNVTTRWEATKVLVTAIAASGGLGGGGKLPRLPGGGGFWKNMFGPLVKMSKPLLKLAKGLSVVSIATLAAEYGFGKLEDQLNKTGNSFGAAGASIGKSAASIAGFAATGFMIGAAFGGVLAPIGAVAGALIGLALEFDNLSESVPTLIERFTKGPRTPWGEAIARDTNENISAHQQSNKKLMKSGLELQRTFKKIEAAANSDKNKFYEMQKELAGLKIGNLKDIGGTAEGFNSAVQGMRDATRKQYEMQLVDFKKQRDEIMSNGKLDADARAAALQRLNKYELTATKNLVDGLNQAVEALFNTPGIIQAGLKKEMAGKMLDFADMGGMSGEEMKKLQKEQEKERRNQSKGVIEAATSSVVDIAAMFEVLKEKKKQAEDDISRTVEAAKGLRNNPSEEEKTAEDNLRSARNEREYVQKQYEASGGFVSGAQKKEAELAEIKAKNEYDRLRERRMLKVKIGGRLFRSQRDTKESKSALDENKTDLETTSSAIEAAQKTVTDNMGVNTALMAKELDEARKNALNRLKVAKDNERDAVKDGKGLKIDPAKKELEAAQGEVDEINEQMDELRKSLSAKISSMDKTLTQKEIARMVNIMTDSEVSLEDMNEELLRHADFWSKYEDGVKKNTEAMGQLDVLKEQKDLLQKERAQLEAVVSSENGINAAQETINNSVKRINDLTREEIEFQNSKLTVLDEEMRNAQRNADQYGRIAKEEGLVGDGIKAQSDAVKAQVALVREGVSHYEELAKSFEDGSKALEASLPDLVRTRKKAQEELNALPANASQEDRLSKQGALDVARARENDARSQISNQKRLAIEARQSALELEESLGKAGDGIKNALDSFNASLTGIRLKNFEDYAAVLANTAEYYGDVSEAATKSFEIVKATAEERYALERQAISEGLEADREKNIEKLSRYMGSEDVAGKSEEEKQALKEKKKADLEAATLSKYQLDLATVELNRMKEVVEGAKRSADLRSSEVDIQQGLVDDAASFASEFGGSFASIHALQQMNVGLAQQQLDIAKQFRDRVQETYEAAAGDAERQAAAGMALMKANADVATKTLSLRRKELGVQKDIMDRLLGRVFGELNANFGARRGMGSDVGIMGVKATRMKSAAGIYVNDVPGGKPGTIAERQAKRMTGGFTGGVWGEGVGTGGPLDELAKQGGPMAEVAKALSKGPTREQQDVLANAMSGTEANTAGILAAVTGRPLGGTGGGRAATATGAGGAVTATGGRAATAATGGSAVKTGGSAATAATGGSAVKTGGSAATAKTVNNQTSVAKGLNQATGSAASKFKGLSGNYNISKMAGLKTGIREMGGLKTGIREMGGLKTGIREMRGWKTGGLDTGGFRLRGTKASSLVPLRTRKATGGIQTQGGGSKGRSVSSVGLSTSSRNSELANNAARAAVVPQSVERAMSVAGAGTAPKEGSGSGGMEIKGEMLVKFDNKAFREVMAPVVVRIMGEPDGSRVIRSTVYGN